ncbi:MAG: CPBP family intramembrane metalloprotease [Bacteroidales bacterium]|nr:CPBP family intramembrane metalloprotease [Bacteroidales bacterium]
MSDNTRHFSLYGKSPLSQLLFSSLIIIVVGTFLFTSFLILGTLIFDRDPGNILENTPSGIVESDIPFIRYLLVIQDISLFIIPSIIILALLTPGNQTCRAYIRKPGLNEVILVVVLAFCIFPVTSITGQLNSGMDLPDWLSGVEKWMKEKEDNADSLIDLLMASTLFSSMVLNIITVAVLPAIGEELIFRGVLQKILCNLFRSGHTAIWVTAFLFSTIHFQFYGFIPRFILGLVFGYLYFWSGTLWLPVIVHFVNNVVPVIGGFILGWEKFNIPLDITWKNILELPVPVLISSMILMYFRKRSKMNSELSTDNIQTKKADY